MDKDATLRNLLERVFTAVETPIAHSYGYIELLQHALSKENIDLEQADQDMERIRVNLERVLLYLEDFLEEYEELR